MTAYEQVCARLPPSGCGRREVAAYGLIEVVGPDAAEFLHRLSSQDVLGLEVGRAAPAAFLNPKGKLITTATIVRTSDGALLEVQSGQLAALAELLDRYHFTEKLALRRRDDLVAAEVLGRAAAVGALMPSRTAVVAPDGVTIAGARRGIGWLRHHASAAACAGWRRDLAAVPEAVADCLRIVAGEVLIGVDTEANTLALEVEIDDHLSTTKGCYTGQEIVARIHTYGHVNRRLALLVVDGAAAIEPGSPLCDVDGDAVGRIMSSAEIPGAATRVGLGFLPEPFLLDPEPLALAAAEPRAVQVEAFAPA